MIKYFKERSYYNDLYDRQTVDECRQWERICKKDDGKPIDLGEGELTKEGRANFLNGMFEFTVHFIKGESYIKKEETIKEWMSRDKTRDDFLENTKPPLVKCKTCFREMNFESKHLWGKNDDRILFLFACPNGCLPNGAVFENGEEWVREPDLCPKCKAEMTRTSEEKEEKITTTYKCSSCGHTIIDKFDALPKKKEIDPDFEKDRARFCLSMEEGLKFIQEKHNWEELDKIIKKEEEKKENKELYDKVDQIKKLSIPQFKEYVINLLKIEVYINLIFEKPEMGPVVSLGFSIEDPTSQQEYDSRLKLSKILKKGLEETNWRLMSDGISYRLGVLTGRFRVYEKEEDLVKLLGLVKNKNDDLSENRSVI